MNKSLLFICTALLLFSCGGVKKTQEALNTGNYNQAIERALSNLTDDKDRKNHQPYVLMLEEAFEKNSERELQHIRFLEKDSNPAHYEEIFKGYTALKSIQQRIQPLLPLQVYNENRKAHFQFRNYDEDILAVKNKLSEYLYTHANSLLDEANNKQDFRRAYEDFRYLNEIHPGYSDSRQKMEMAYQNGLHFVKVKMINDTEQIVPARLEQELLNFNTYGLNDFWTQYHANPLEGIHYDYEMEVALREIRISPEQTREKQIIREKQIKDGTTFLLDEDGHVVRDSLGNEIKIDRFRTVQCNFYQFTQQKSAMVSGNVRYIDLLTEQQIQAYPLASEFRFEHIYANYEGDKRALENDMVSLLGLAAVPFPTNEQMVYDAGEELKMRLKDILVRHRFE